MILARSSGSDSYHADTKTSPSDTVKRHFPAPDSIRPCSICGWYSTGMTPAWFTLIGMYVDVPPYIFRPTMRLAYCTGMRRCACSTYTTPLSICASSRNCRPFSSGKYIHCASVL